MEFNIKADVTGHPLIEEGIDEFDSTGFRGGNISGVRVKLADMPTLENGVFHSVEIGGKYVLLNRQIYEKALTTGFDPATTRELYDTLGHEFTHVVQERTIANFRAAWSAANKRFGGVGNNPFEVQAKSVGARFRDYMWGPK